MKELSIEEKAKRYDEALERAKNTIEVNQAIPDIVECVESLFHELAESGDEKIRKEITEFFKNYSEKGTWKAIPDVKKWIAWLEKQGKEIIPLEEIILNVWELGNYWKELTKGFCNTEHGSQLDYIVKHWKEGEHYIKSFEKQDEKPDDKVEPKFKVGDWIVDNNIKTPFLITDTSNGKYDVISTYGTDFWFSFNEVEHYYHLWTIQDAKEGDVLVDEGNNIGIYKEIEGFCWHSYIYLGNDNHLYGFSIGGSHMQNHTKPATKEQHDALFAKMKESGYEWDAELKQLKKIEKKNIEGAFINVDEVRENFVKEVYRVLANDTTNDRANDIIYYFDSLPTIYLHIDKPLPSDDDFDMNYIFENHAWDDDKKKLEKDEIKIKVGRNYRCTKTHKYAGLDWLEGTKYYADEDYSLVNNGCACFCPKHSKYEHNNLFEEVKCDDCVEKQGEQKPMTEKFEHELAEICNQLLSEIDSEWMNNEILNCIGTSVWLNLCDETAKRYKDGLLKLAKQGEQKPAEWSEEDETTFKVMLEELEKYVMFKQYSTPLSVYDLQWFKSIKDRVQPRQEWSEEDEKKRKCLIKGLEDRMGFGWASDPFSREEYINWLKTLKDRIHPKVEWDKDDEYYYGIIQYILNNECVGKTDKENAINWFKSFKDRIQSKQEWSEAEQQIIEDAASFILSCVNTAETKKEEKRLEELADKLQDLKPHNRWKPSDRDIKLLRELSDGKICPDNYRARLYEIINNLKYL